MDDDFTIRLLELMSLGESDLEMAETLSSEFGLIHLSERTVRRKRSELGLNRREPLPNLAVDALVNNAVTQIGHEPGRAFVKGYMVSQNYPTISEKRIGHSLKRLYPARHSARLSGVSRRTNPQRYRAEYFGDKLHMDQNEKAAMYGLTYVAAIDGYSGMILKCEAMPVKNPIRIYDVVFEPILSTYGIWNQVVVDMGTEFNLALSVQNSLEDFRRNIDVVPVRRVKSTLNNRIERFWPELNSRVTFPIKAALISMEDSGQLDISDPVHRFCCSEAAQSVARVGLVRHVDARNHHHVRGRGVPRTLMQERNHAVQLPEATVYSVDLATREYRAAGGELTDPSPFGADPLSARPDLQGARADRLNDYSLENIYESCLPGQRETLSQYVGDYIDATVNFCNYL